MIKPIALYLPQFHPIPENDLWWGKGFTEWSNVTKAQPLYKGHWQPRLPADLGFYDLRVPEVRQAQADLAKQYGMYGFCYWHYWFAGKRIIERPFQEVLNSGKPNFPFCLAWANQTWSGTWHGLSNKKVLIEQTYPGEQDYVNHFYANLEAFQDSRYIEVNGKKLFFVFQPLNIPDSKRFISIWQDLAVKEGLKGIHFVGMNMMPDWSPKEDSYDAVVQFWSQRNKYRYFTKLEKIAIRLFGFDFVEKIRIQNKKPLIISYDKFVNKYPDLILRNDEYPLVYSDWDNTPRSGPEGWVFKGFSPDLFEELCLKAFKATDNKPDDEKIVIVKSWNEWAEGNYVEPDKKHGFSYLQAINNALLRFNDLSL